MLLDKDVGGENLMPKRLGRASGNTRCAWDVSAVHSYDNVVRQDEENSA